VLLQLPEVLDARKDRRRQLLPLFHIIWDSSIRRAVGFGVRGSGRCRKKQQISKKLEASRALCDEVHDGQAERRSNKIGHRTTLRRSVAPRLRSDDNVARLPFPEEIHVESLLPIHG
jgi:hypothetical protein